MLQDQRPGSDDAIAPDVDSLANRGVDADEAIFLDFDLSRDRPLGGNEAVVANLDVMADEAVRPNDHFKEPSLMAFQSNWGRCSHRIAMRLNASREANCHGVFSHGVKRGGSQ